jgi:hypothetical protein
MAHLWLLETGAQLPSSAIEEAVACADRLFDILSRRPDLFAHRDSRIADRLLRQVLTDGTAGRGPTGHHR